MEEQTDCPHCLADCELTTYSTSITSNKFRWSIYSYMYTVHENIQVVWLKKCELEPLLQLDQHLSGEMAANHQRNLRQHQHHLRRRAAWTHETKIPTSHDWGRTTFSSFRGKWFRFISAKIKTFYQKGNPKYNAYDKDIAVFNIYFGDSTVFGKFSQYLFTVCPMT